MFVRRAVAWISTVVVAVVVALAVPVSQLRTITFIKRCCCPDPGRCHCPDDKPDSSTQPSMRACHNTERAIVAPELPAFHAPAVAIVVTPTLVASDLARVIVGPRPPPAPTRPDAPS